MRARSPFSLPPAELKTHGRQHLLQWNLVLSEQRRQSPPDSILMGDNNINCEVISFLFVQEFPPALLTVVPEQGPQPLDFLSKLSHKFCLGIFVHNGSVDNQFRPIRVPECGERFIEVICPQKKKKSGLLKGNFILFSLEALGKGPHLRRG